MQREINYIDTFVRN